jgi:hypothetical protein
MTADLGKVAYVAWFKANPWQRGERHPAWEDIPDERVRQAWRAVGHAVARAAADLDEPDEVDELDEYLAGALADPAFAAAYARAQWVSARWWRRLAERWAPRLQRGPVNPRGRGAPGG